ncbi:MAG: aldo/keto reductase [Chloroflexi bacterium]|nr:aldo/keto reductase [Chloroflexota bacterium]
MQTLSLGKSGVDVSALCLGAMYFGTRNDHATSYRMLDMYLDAGGTFIDTANIYAHWADGGRGGESETLLGEWLRERGNRANLFIASKVGFEYGDVPRELNARRIEEECNRSLRRMGIDTIDLYYAHNDYGCPPLDEVLAAFDRLVRAGKVRFIGASNYRAWRLEAARCLSQSNGWAAYCCVQQRHTYLPPRPGTSFGAQIAANDDLLDYCRATGLRLLAYSALLSGAYTRDDRPLPPEYLSAGNEQRLRTLRDVAAEMGATVNQIILAWMLHGDPPVIPLIAASTKAQMQENLGALDVHLNAEQMQRLNVAGTAV